MKKGQPSWLTFVMGILMPVTGKLFDRFGARWLAIIGLLILITTTISFTNLTDWLPLYGSSVNRSADWLSHDPNADTNRRFKSVASQT